MVTHLGFSKVAGGLDKEWKLWECQHQSSSSSSSLKAKTFVPHSQGPWAQLWARCLEESGEARLWNPSLTFLAHPLTIQQKAPSETLVIELPGPWTPNVHGVRDEILLDYGFKIWTQVFRVVGHVVLWSLPTGQPPLPDGKVLLG